MSEKRKYPGRYLLAIPGLILILAGLLKLHATMTAVTLDDFAGTITLIFSEAEVLVGLWLTSGIGHERSRPWAIVIFSGLWGSNLFQVFAGRCSCGCFGVLPVNPWIVLLLDSFVLLTLLWWQLSGMDQGVTFSSPLDVVGMPIILFTVVLIGVQQQPLIVFTGTAYLRGQVLPATKILVRGGSLEFSIVTDRKGFFQSPPLRPGQYSLSIDKPTASSKARTAAPSQALSSGRFGSSDNRSISGLRGNISHEVKHRITTLARRYDEVEIAPLVLDECDNISKSINFN